MARGVEMKWQLVGRHLKTTDDSPVKLRVEVLSEELAYNKALQQFKIFIVSSPLDPEYKACVLCCVQAHARVRVCVCVCACVCVQ